MNNRIMAMLCALVAAMFLSIVPVKAEAACAHKDLEYVPAKAATCEEAGHRDYQVCKKCGQMIIGGEVVTEANVKTEEPTGHNYSDKWFGDGENHWHICKNEGCESRSDVTAHEIKYTSNGNQTHSAKCTICDAKLTELKAAHVDANKDCVCDVCNGEIPHDLELVESVEPACEKAGNWAHNKCKTCGKLFSKDTGEELTEDQVVRAALEHKWNKNVSCDDNSHYYRCLNEGCEARKDEAAHTFECKSNGKDTHSAKCSFCGRTPDALQKVDHVDENKDCVCDACNADIPHEPELVEAVAPTCEKAGVYEHLKCKVCGKLFSAKDERELEAEEIVWPALEHDWSMITDDENHFYICNREGCDAKKDVEAHTFKYTSNGEKTHSATCTVCGRKPAALQKVSHNYVLDQKSQDGVGQHQMVCSDCNYKQWLDCVDENSDCKCDICDAEMPHKYENVTYVAGVAASCEKDGYENHYECKQCGKTFYTKGASEELVECDPTIKATGHDWKYIKFNGDKHLVKCKNDNCDLDGQATIIDHEDTNGDCKCDLNGCGQLVHSHRMVIHAEVPATCEEDGTEAYYTYQDCGKMFDLDQNPIKEPKVIKATGHDLSDEWVPGENGQHVRKCADCEYCEAEDHVFKNGNVTCAVCGAEENLTYVAAKDATCTEQGNVAYWTSKVTGKKYADEAGTKELKDVIVPATGHELTGFVDNGDGKHSQHCQNPGCKYEEGNALHRAAENGCYCVDCGGALDGHELTLVKAVAATCEKAGTEAYFQCSCGAKYDLEGQSIVKPATIAKLAHTTNGVVKKDTKEGKHYTECTTCGKKFYEEHVMAVEDPMKGNYHQYVCECGELKVEQHYDKDGDKFCDVCNHSMSSSSVTVEQHDNVTVKTGDASTINKRYTWWRNWLEALFPSNSGGTVASAQKTEETSAASAQTVAPAANSASQNTNQNATASSGTTAGETVVNTNALTQFVSWFLGLFGF